MARIIVSIISKQIITNYLFIKDMFRDGDEILFISSSDTQDRIEWLVETLSKEIKYSTLVFDSAEELQIGVVAEKIEGRLSKEREYVVDLSGDEKFIPLISHNIFAKYNSSLYYILFPKNIIVNLTSGIEQKLMYRLSVREYMQLNNIEIKIKIQEPTQEISYTESLFARFADVDFYKQSQFTTETLRLYRKKGVNIEAAEGISTSSKLPQIPNLSKFVQDIEFAQLREGELNKHEVRYITGGWFEEYVYHLVKRYIEVDDIIVGAQIHKIGTDLMTGNELDVVFTYGNKIFVIECKFGGTDKERMLKKIAYKASSLKQNFLGQYAYSYIFSLSQGGEKFMSMTQNLGVIYYDLFHLTCESEVQKIFNEIAKVANG